MLVPHGNNLTRIKRSNQASILQAIYHFGPIKRSDIAQRLELTLPTITTNISAMISAGLVRETDEPEASPGYPGRKPRPVDIVPEARHFAGVEMQGSRRAVCIVDFRGRVIASAKEEALHRDYEQNMERSCALLQSTAERCALSLAELDGVCFCVPGLVNSAAGVLDFRPSFGWRDKPIRADAAALTGYTGPIHVENNACARAYGAQLFRRAQLDGARTFAYLFISAGIACPLVLNTAGSFGSVVGAGEVGHMVMERGGAPCSCGNRGCLEAYASDRAVLDGCRAALERGGAPRLRARCPDPEALTMADVLSAQAAGDPQVSAVVERAVCTLGVAVANIENFACPRVMLVEGELFRAECNRSRLRSVVDENLCQVIHTDGQFIFVEPDEYGGAMGAAARAIGKSLESGAG